MLCVNYEQLKAWHRDIKPYRNTNEIPMWNRRHRGKFMVPREVDGKTEYLICYWYQYTPHDITEAQFKALSVAEQKDYSLATRYNPTETIYRKYTREPNVLGIVRDDNTIEFTAKYMGQGDRYFMSQLSRGLYYRAGNKGGVFYRNYRSRIEQIIFKGLRINIETLEPHESCKYEVVSRTVGRKEAKKALAHVKEPFKIAEVMLKGYSIENFLQGVYDMERTVLDEDENTHYGAGSDTLAKLRTAGLNLLSTDEVGGAMLLMLSVPYGRLGSRVHNYVQNGVLHSWYGQVEPIEYFYSMQKQIYKEIYKGCEGVLKERTHLHGEHIPASQWPIDIKLNGEVVESY